MSWQDGVAAGGRHRAVPGTRPDRFKAAAAGWPGAVTLLVAALIGALVADLGALDGASLDHGWLVDVLVAAAVVGTVLAAFGHRLRWWLTWGAGLAGAAVGLVAAGAWWLRHTGLVVEHYPATFFLWAWLALWAVGLAATGWHAGGVAVRTARLLNAPLAVLTAFCLVQSHYGYWPTLGALLQRPAPGQVSAAVFSDRLRNPHPGPVRLGQLGRYGPVALPAISGFEPGRAWIWLPPDFADVPHAHLPVMLMLTGTPGTAQDWVQAGRSTSIANRWARTHGGAGSVMVFVDENGGGGRDTECVDGPQGEAETFLTQTLPGYLERSYGIQPSPDRSAVIGFSEGGTCALGLAIEHPEVYGRFVDLAGDLAPNYGHELPPRVTLTRLYGGDAALELAHDPLHILSTHHYVGTEGWLSAGRDDRQHVSVVQTLTPAARAAGIDVHPIVSSGGHTWRYASRVFGGLYPTLIARLGTDPATPTVGR